MLTAAAALTGMSPAQRLLLEKRAAAPAPAVYTAKAVRFDGNATLTRPSLIVTDSALGYASLWLLAEGAGIKNDSPWLVDDAFNTTMGVVGATPPYDMTILVADTNNVVGLAGATFPAVIATNAWIHLLFAWDTTRTSNNFALYKNDVLLAGSDPLSAIGVVGWAGMSNVGVVASTIDTPSTVGRFADFWTAVGSTILQADGTINAADRRRFISAAGKPVDPATAVAAYGTPMLRFSGNAAAFPINQGSGGAFTLAGSLTDVVSGP